MRQNRDSMNKIAMGTLQLLSPLNLRAILVLNVLVILVPTCAPDIGDELQLGLCRGVIDGPKCIGWVRPSLRSRHSFFCGKHNRYVAQVSSYWISGWYLAVLKRYCG